MSFGPMDLIGQLTSDHNYTTNGTESFGYNSIIYGSMGNPIATEQLAATIMWNSIHS